MVKDIICKRTPAGPVVNVRHKLVFHSPTGFEWGYGGSGPADLALNVLLEFTTPEMAMKHHQDFKWDFIARMPREGGIILHTEIEKWLKEREGG